MEAHEWLEREREENLAVADFIKEQAAAVERAKVEDEIRTLVDTLRCVCAEVYAGVGHSEFLKAMELLSTRYPEHAFALAHHEGEAE